MKEPIDTAAIAQSFTLLSTAASRLNVARDELNDAVERLNERLKSIHLGLSGWVDCATTSTSVRSVGYAKLAGNWGLQVRLTHKGADKDVEFEFWWLRDAPSWMRLEAVKYIPDLLIHLVAQAQTATATFEAKANELHKIVDALPEYTPVLQAPSPSTSPVLSTEAQI